MKVSNNTLLPSRVVRKVIHWVIQDLQFQGTRKLFPNGFYVSKTRTHQTYVSAIKGEAVRVHLSPEFRKCQDIPTQLVELGFLILRRSVFLAPPAKAQASETEWSRSGVRLVVSWLAEERARDRVTPSGVRASRLKALEAKLRKARKSQANWVRKSRLAKTKLAKYNAQVKRYSKLVDEQAAIIKDSVWAPFQDL